VAIMNDKLVELRDLLARQSIRHGEFTLASGARSTYYCDTKATTLSPRGSLLVGQILHPLMRARGAEAVGGLAMGSVFITTAVTVVSALEGSPISGFAVRQREKDHGTKRSVEESFHPDGPLLRPGRRVAVVEDVVTGGGSIDKAIQEVTERGCEIVLVAAVVDRRAGGGDRLRARGLPYVALFDLDERGELHVNPLPAARNA
jgi:orotate phosphoribosyltransferase